MLEAMTLKLEALASWIGISERRTLPTDIGDVLYIF